MIVFISYAREDEALAHLLSHILTKTGVRCLIDSQLPQARPFDDKLKHMIEESDLVLVLLTKSSLSSAWVNQEIGYAVAHGKRIWPVSMEKNLEPEGLIKTIGTYSLFDWADPEHTIERLVKTCKKELGEYDDTYEFSGADQILTDKLQRTKFIANRLSRLQKNKQERICILNQAAFSIFGFSDNEIYASASGHSREYMDALAAEREAMEDLLKKESVKMQLLLWPVRAYDPEFLHIRFDNLLAWMREKENHPRVQFRCSSFSGRHRLVVSGQFDLEGRKLGDSTGYEMTIVRYH